MENIKEINLAELLTAIIRKIWLVVLCAVLVGVAAYIYTDNFVKPMYRASVSIYVNNKINSNNASGVSTSDIDASKQLVATYVEILRSNTVIEKVSENIYQRSGKRISAGNILGAMTAEAMGNTELFRVFISAPNPEDAALVANAIADVAPGEIARFIEGSSAQTVDYAKIPTAPYTPNKTQNATKGMLGGAVVAVVLILLQTLLDVRIKSEEDLALISPAPVLGMIPDLILDSELNQYGYRAEYKSRGHRVQPLKAKDGEGEA